MVFEQPQPKLNSCDHKHLKYKFSRNLQHLFFQTRVISSLAQSGIPRIRACLTIIYRFWAQRHLSKKGKMLIHSSSFSFFNLHNHYHHQHHHHLSKKEKMLMYSSNFSFDNPAAAWVTKQCNQDDRHTKFKIKGNFKCFVHRFDLLVPTLLFL